MRSKTVRILPFMNRCASMIRWSTYLKVADPKLNELEMLPRERAVNTAFSQPRITAEQRTGMETGSKMMSTFRHNFSMTVMCETLSAPLLRTSAGRTRCA